MIDTGIRTTHQDFNGRAFNAADFVGGSNCGAHGTHVAGIIGSNTYGVAKDATLHSVKVYLRHHGIDFGADRRYRLGQVQPNCSGGS
ncbi:MAG TPA: S8 family serine peptidase [Pyrinomonadaceae bacterium]|nr:S8 family serine peptidase [Pyrinomonadaceae bacterium]